MPPEDAIDDHRLHQLLGTLVERHRIPGAVLGVVDGNRTVSVGAGTANLNTGAAMTADTRFLLGSVTKVWIATLTMSMVALADVAQFGYDALQQKATSGGGDGGS